MARLAHLRNIETTGVIQGVTSQLATFPIASPSGGFTFVFDPSLGIVSRPTRSFGPAFAESALTNGRGKISVGVNFQHVSYDKFDGLDASGFWIGPINMAIGLRTDTTVFVADSGISDRLDIAVVVPVTRVSLDTKISRPKDTFKEPGSAGGTSNGLGDITVRGKFGLLRRGPGGMGVAVDLRLPTGDFDNLLGAGRPQVTFTAIASTELRRVGPHLNLSYMSDLTDARLYSSCCRRSAFAYAAGVTVVASSRVTLIADVLGRSWGGTTGMPKPVLFTFGTKANIHGNLLVSANALVAATKNGLTSSFAPSVGLGYTF